MCHRALDIRYPNQVDAAVNKALAPLGKGRKKNKKKGDDAAEGDDGDDEVVKAARRVLDFVTGALDKRSARKPLPDASATLAHAVDAPSAELRRTVSLSASILHSSDIGLQAKETSEYAVDLRSAP